ncbi:DSD1 family PLP-dependent enzyme [Rhodopseudomonas sp. P2A-2r]|uniref:DSD1 family PLP-dependent enzyme n=1 Tax=unclassified Rhodopseudomonas TaxID=2638247 RepID=UPI0022340A5D|nr:DSD1 family PLP-dependent enzyme [Rhodopseudomonas sp. P2A-2r]UZE48006.1 DSD1 family PLP-dependent enzyme [Rhodopseudomonas sp. P2A-2r]
MTFLLDIETPAAIVDVARMQRNIARMQDRMNAFGVSFRPHVKTTKCVAVADRQRAAGATGITVSTLREAEEFFAAGHDDILYAVCIAPHKLERAGRLRQQGCRLTILVDSIAIARAVVEAQTRCGPFDFLIEVDSDGHRSGVGPEDADLIEIARILDTGGATLRGVLTHAGNSYDLHDPASLQQLAEQERALSVRAAERLRAAGFPCPVVSVGSTPTALSARALDGVTEVRCGVYVFFDLFMTNVGVCAIDDIALSVLTTVIGHQPDKGWVIVDAGWMAMSRDRGTARQSQDYGYGLVCDAAGKPIEERLVMIAANQEHGILAAPDAAAMSVANRFPIGTRLRILPNHACATGAQFSQYHAVGDAAPATWKRFNGW